MDRNLRNVLRFVGNKQRRTEADFMLTLYLLFPFFFRPTVTSHSVTKRPVDANRKPPRTGTVPWGTATQARHLGAASWTAARRRCGRGSREGGTWVITGQSAAAAAAAAAGGGRTRFDGKQIRRLKENCDTETHVEANRWTHECAVFLCLHEPSSHSTQGEGWKGQISFGALSSYCLTTGIYLILFF